MYFENIYLAVLPYAVIGGLVYHYINIITFMVWVVLHERPVASNFQMPWGLPRTLFLASTTDWVEQVCGNLFMVSFLIAFYGLIWPVMLVFGLPIWFVSSARQRLYNKE